MTYRSESKGLLAKHSGSWLDKNFDDLEADLAKGMHSGEIPPWFLIRTYCQDCDESCLAIRHKGKRHLVHEVAGRLSLHQCPQPAPEVYPDDPEVRDGSGNLRGGGWTDAGDDQDRRQFDDPKYSFDYPDIPYVDPTQGNR